MAKKKSRQDNLGFSEDDIRTLDQAMDIIINHDREAKRARNPRGHVARCLSKTRGYFDSNFESRLALLSLSISEGTSVLHKLSGKAGCGNNCQAACKITCTIYCKGTCKGGCKGGVVFF